MCLNALGKWANTFNCCYNNFVAFPRSMSVKAQIVLPTLYGSTYGFVRKFSRNLVWNTHILNSFCALNERTAWIIPKKINSINKSMFGCLHCKWLSCMRVYHRLAPIKATDRRILLIHCFSMKTSLVILSLAFAVSVASPNPWGMFGPGGGNFGWGGRPGGSFPGWGGGHWGGMWPPMETCEDPLAPTVDVDEFSQYYENEVFFYFACESCQNISIFDHLNVRAWFLTSLKRCHLQLSSTSGKVSQSPSLVSACHQMFSWTSPLRSGAAVMNNFAKVKVPSVNQACTPTWLRTLTSLQSLRILSTVWCTTWDTMCPATMLNQATLPWDTCK